MGFDFTEEGSCTDQLDTISKRIGNMASTYSWNMRVTRNLHPSGS